MLKKIIKWFFIVIVTLILGSGLALYLFKDQIIKQVIAEVNQHIMVPIEVSKVDIDFFHGLPSISVAFHDVAIIPDRKPLLEARRLYAILNPLSIIQGDLDIANLEIVDAKIRLHTNIDGQNNLTALFDSKQAAINDSTPVASGFNLNNIRLRNINLEYQNDLAKTHQELAIHDLSGSLSYDSGHYASRIIGEITLSEVSTASWSSEISRDLNLNISLIYNEATESVQFSNSQLRYLGALAIIDGSIVFGTTPQVDLKVDGEDISFQLISELLPRRYQDMIRKYRGAGDLGFNARLKGLISDQQLPSIVAHLSLNNVDLTDAEYNANINNLTLDGQFRMSDISNLKSASVEVSSAIGELMGKPFKGSFNLSNFEDPRFDGTFSGTLSTLWVLASLKYPGYDTGEGELDVMLDMSTRKSIEGPLISGYVDLREVKFEWSDSVKINNLSGKILLKNSGLDFTNVKLDWLGSDILINGSIDDISEFEQATSPLILKANVKSTLLDIDDIVALIRTTPKLATTEGDSTEFPALAFDMMGTFDSLKFQRFHGAKIAGEFLYEDKVLEVVDLNGRGIGGAMKVNGKLEVKQNDDFYIEAKAVTKGVYLDSLFYIFHNFSQDFIKDEHLRGKIYADISTSMYFEKNWRFRSKLLLADAKIGIVQGELNDFEPIMALSSYIDDKEDSLSRLRFSDLVNKVQIRQDTIFIPEMSIHTNVRNIALGGYHTLDQHINYRLAVPIINERVDKDESFGAVRKSSMGSPNLLFRIKGTAFDYKVNYDLLRATGNILKLLDITRIFKKKEEIPYDSSFLDDEEFDWNK